VREVPVRWVDLDALGHVGHTAVLALLEEGRDAWLGSLGIMREGYVIGRCTITFHHEIGREVAAVRVSCSAAEVRRSSLTTAERLCDEEGRLLVDAAFDLVLWDPERRRSRPITEDERRALIRDAEVIA
jgi:acyl-CoA thioesterase FadM